MVEMKTRERVEKLMDTYGEDRIFEAGIDAMLENIKILFMKRDYKGAIESLKKVVSILEKLEGG